MIWLTPAGELAQDVRQNCYQAQENAPGRVMRRCTRVRYFWVRPPRTTPGICAPCFFRFSP